MAASLPGLLPELFDIILSLLQVTDILRLRFVSRELADRCFCPRLRTRFAHITISLPCEDRKLDALARLAERYQLGRQLETLCICGTLYTSYPTTLPPPYSPIEDDGPLSPVVPDVKRPNVVPLTRVLRAFAHGAADGALKSVVLKVNDTACHPSPALRDVFVLGNEENADRDTLGAGRQCVAGARANSSKSVNNYGVVITQVPRYENHHGARTKQITGWFFNSKTFSSMMTPAYELAQAMAASTFHTCMLAFKEGSIPVRSLDLFNSAGRCPLAIDSLSASLQVVRLGKLGASLRYLSLGISLLCLRDERVLRHKTSVSQLLKQCPNLEDLELDWYKAWEPTLAKRPAMSPPDQTTICNQISDAMFGLLEPSPPRFQNLQRLTLRRFHMTSCTLRQVIERMPLLRRLVLEQVNLTEGDLREIFDLLYQKECFEHLFFYHVWAMGGHIEFPEAERRDVPGPPVSRIPYRRPRGYGYVAAFCESRPRRSATSANAVCWPDS